MNSSARSVVRDAGFTLVEMLTVLVIIGLMSSAVVLTFPKQKSPLAEQAQDFLRAVNGVSQDAILSGQTTALGVSREGYALYKFGPQGWETLNQSLWADTGQAQMEIAQENLDLPEDVQPLIFFESIGVSEPFTLTLSDRNVDYIFRSNGDNRIILDTRS